MRRARVIMAAAGACGVIVAVTGAASPGTWTFQTPPIPGTSSSVLNGVSCRGTSFCMAVGSYKVNANPNTGQTNKSVPLADKWNGTTWTSVPVPAPQPKTNSSSLMGVSCTSATFCMAVGTGPTSGLSEEWNGSKWSIITTPGGANLGQAVSCTSASACTAVGSAVARWNGTTWSTQPNPLTDTPGPGGSGLDAVSCSGAKSCTAMGGGNGVNAFGEQAEQWNGTQWSLLPDAPVPADTQETELLGLSCTGAGACTATGINFTADPSSPSGNGSLALAERWNGSQWTIQQTAALPGAHNAELASVSCMTKPTTTCTAVGYSDLGNPADGAMAETWDGTSWSVDNPIPMPAKSRSSQLFGVSCSAPGTCTAVGRWNGAQGGQHAYAVHK
jgi:hypothetical protein